MPVADFAHGVKTPFFAMVNHTNDGARAKPGASTTATTSTSSTDKSATTQTASTSGDDGKSFWDDVLDVVNPLQHLPIVGTVYRAVTGDKIGDVEKVAGDTLYGGPMGLVSSLADLAFEKITGKDFGDTVMSALGLEHDDAPATALAANTPKVTTTNTAVASNAAAKPTTLSAKPPHIVASTSPTPLSKLTASTTPMITQEKIVTQPAPQPAAQAAPQAAQATTVSAQQQAAASAQKPVDISADTDALLNALARNGVNGDMQAQALDAYRRTMSMNSAPSTGLVN